MEIRLTKKQAEFLVNELKKRLEFTKKYKRKEEFITQLIDLAETINYQTCLSEELLDLTTEMRK